MNDHFPNIFPSLPETLAELIPLALDLRWSWSHVSDVLWESLDPELWHHTGNPWLILQSLSSSRLKQLSRDKSFCDQLKELAEERRNYLDKETWFQEIQEDAPLECIAYFSMEYGLTEALPLYSGGLGILAGDFLKSCSDLGVPVVGIGLFYQEGFFRQIIDEKGRQTELYPNNNPWEMPVQPVRTQDDQLLRMRYRFNGFDLWVRVWQARVGRNWLYLLDLNDPANPPSDRCLTDRLYGGGTEQRLQQEMLLGIVGWQLLETLDLKPTVCHLNEGHAALAVLERARSYMNQNQVDFELALSVTRAGNLFTTHTPVAAGFDRFPPHLIERHLGFYCALLDVPLDHLLALGRENPDDAGEAFNMAWLAIRGSGAVNAVSRLHGEVSRRIFQPLFPRWPQWEIPVGHVTNGIHTPSWDSPESDRLWTGACGRERWICDPCRIGNRIRKVAAEELWEFRSRNRQRLVKFVQGYHAHRPYAFHYLPAGTPLLDPNALTLGFARRFTAYKRPNLLLSDPQRLARLLQDPLKPVQVVIAGKAHPQDEEGKAMIQTLIAFIHNHPDTAGKVIFLPDYDIQLAEQLVEGVDVWINTPRRPWEACGTSGMKVLVNGGLNLSELDGWWSEAFDPTVGWHIGDGNEHDDDPVWDLREAQQLYEVLERQVVPAFYDRDKRGIPTAWVAKMRESMARLTPFFSANRMVRQYTDQYYLPLARNLVRRQQDEGKAAQEILRWRQQLTRHWQNIHFGPLEVESDQEHHRFTIPVYLGAIPPEAVRVEIYADPPKSRQAPWHPAMVPQHPLHGALGGFLYSGQAPASRPREHYTIRIIPHHPEANVPLECNLILWHH